MIRETVVGTIVNIARVHNSYNGNPRFEITLDNGRALRTAADHSFVYGPMPTAGMRVSLAVNGRGTVEQWSAPPSSFPVR